MTSMPLTGSEIDELKYAERNLGRTFRARFEGCQNNAIIDRLTETGLLRDGGQSTFGRWRELTASGRAALNHGQTGQDK